MTSPSPITGLRTAATRPRILPIAENAERITCITRGLDDIRSMCPMLDIDARNADIVDALDQRGCVMLTAGLDGRVYVS
jgi:hypothetical protein